MPLRSWCTQAAAVSAFLATPKLRPLTVRSAEGISMFEAKTAPAVRSKVELAGKVNE